eukprot:Amastigsp_a387_3.p2 type:complete len:129 gc:universal Amastigsp_a387_3:816-430(-)
MSTRSLALRSGPRRSALQTKAQCRGHGMRPRALSSLLYGHSTRLMCSTWEPRTRCSIASRRGTPRRSSSWLRSTRSWALWTRAASRLGSLATTGCRPRVASTGALVSRPWPMRSSGSAARVLKMGRLL